MPISSCSASVCLSVCLFAEAVAKLFALYASARHSNGVPCGASSASFCLSYPSVALPLTVTHCRLRAHEHWLHPINSTFKYMYLIVLNLWTSTAALIVHRYIVYTPCEYKRVLVLVLWSTCSVPYRNKCTCTKFRTVTQYQIVHQVHLHEPVPMTET